MKKTVASVEIKGQLKSDIEHALNQLGGLQSFVTPHDRVLLKPNFNTADPFPASTDIAFLKAVVELVYKQNPKQVIIGESSTFRLRAKDVMRKLGVYDFQKTYPELVIHDFNDGKWVKKSIPNGKYLKKASIPEILDQVDKIILLPCCKTHSIGKFTGSIKLAVGFMRPRERLSMHIRKVQEKIAELNTLYNPDLIIMDARKCFINKGPSKGTIENPNTILASYDRIAIDIEGIKIIQSYKGNSLADIKPNELVQIKYLAELLGKSI